MGRTTVYNQITDEDKISKINADNKSLMEDFLDYLTSVDRSPKTINVYRSDLNIFFVWNLEYNGNKFFTKLTKRELARFQNHAINDWKWSPKRVRRVKSVLSSMSNFIENVLDDEEEFKDFRPIIKKIESPVNEPVREKTVLADEQIDLLLDTLVERQEYEKACAIAIAVYSGMRKQELIQMRMSFFNTDHLKFNCLYETDKIRAKGRGVRGKVINKYVMNKVDKYINLWKQQREELGVDIDWVFVSKHNGVWEQRKTLDMWKDEFSEIVNAPFYFHCLRHKLCSELVAANVPSEVIREFFKWESAEMISVYNDNSAVDDFEKYFTSDGIVKHETKGLEDIGK